MSITNQIKTKYKRSLVEKIIKPNWPIQNKNIQVDFHVNLMFFSSMLGLLLLGKFTPMAKELMHMMNVILLPRHPCYPYKGIRCHLSSCWAFLKYKFPFRINFDKYKHIFLFIYFCFRYIHVTKINKRLQHSQIRD